MKKIIFLITWLWFAVAGTAAGCPYGTEKQSLGGVAGIVEVNVYLPVDNRPL